MFLARSVWSVVLMSVLIIGSLFLAGYNAVALFRELRSRKDKKKKPSSNPSEEEKKGGENN